MGRNSQRKGRSAELELVKLLRDAGYQDAAPGPPMSFGTTPDITGLPGVHIEVKSIRNLDLPAALRQAREDSAYFEDGLPTVFHRHRGAGWVVSVTLTDWLTLYDGWAKCRKVQDLDTEKKRRPKG